MFNSSAAPAKPLSDAEYEAMADQLLQDIHALNTPEGNPNRAENYRREMSRLKAESEQLRQEGLRLQAELTACLDRLFQIKPIRYDSARLERENLTLRLENTLLKSGQALPPSDTNKTALQCRAAQMPIYVTLFSLKGFRVLPKPGFRYLAAQANPQSARRTQAAFLLH